MRKTYMKPSVREYVTVRPELLSGSGVKSNAPTDIGYGGVDTDGTMEPSARQYNLWDDEEDYL